MKVCVLYSEELTIALLKYLQATYPKQVFTSERQPRADHLEYEFELQAPSLGLDSIRESQVKLCATHFLNGYRAGIAQCEAIVKGEGMWENDAVQASVDNLS